jgi:8-oxo-dGTP pyrophosphatase MutT (NUDIX family)
MTAVQRRAGGRQLLPRPVQWRELQHAPWDRLDTSALTDISAIHHALSRYQPDPVTQQPPAQVNLSAVLVPLFLADEVPQVLLTRRSEVLTTHQGQIAFPGGRIEPGETSLQAALRETREEIGVDASTARILGELSAHRTISSTSHIVPHVAQLASPPTHFLLNPEVDRVLSVSLAELIRPDTFAQEHWVFPDREVVVPMFYLDDETVWGATARMLQDLILLILQK